VSPVKVAGLNKMKYAVQFAFPYRFSFYYYGEAGGLAVGEMGWMK
jgi:hypothetical protein